MKKKGLLALCLASMLVISACGNTDETIVETSKGNITKDELYSALKELQGEIALQSLVYEKLLSKDFDVTEKVKKQMDDLKEMYGDSLETMIQQQVKLPSIEAYENQLRLNLLISEYIKSKFSEDEVKKLQPIQASHILIGSDVENAEKKAKDLKKQLDEGADFATLAKENSTDGSAANGGSLGTFGKGEMVAPFEEAAYKLKVGEISDIVKSDFGYHIIKLTATYDQATDEEKKKMRDEIIEKKIQSDPTLAEKHLTELVKSSNVKVLDKDLKNIFSTSDEKKDTTTEEK